VVMIHEDKAAELIAANHALRCSLASLTSAEDLWPFVIGVLRESAQAIAAPLAAMFLFDEQSNRMRTAIVLEEGQQVDFFNEDRFIELREPFEVEQSPFWQELVTNRGYQWRDLADESRLPLKCLIPWYRRLGFKRGLAVPLIFSGGPIGLAVYDCSRRELPPSNRLELVRNFIQEAAVAIQLLKFSGRARDAEIANEGIRAVGEVHESVAQSLAAISMQLAGAQSCLKSDPEKAAKAIDKARQLARLGIQLVRRTTVVLRPGHSGANGSSETLVHFIRDSARERGLICDFREIGQIPRTLGSETEKGLLQISREAIKNALEHGRARSLKAILTWYADRVKLEIIDDGAGFDLRTFEQNGEARGINGMREYAARRGGTLEIGSRVGHGTSVCATFPILNV
jgi:signal transduction histidine kinase